MRPRLLASLLLLAASAPAAAQMTPIRKLDCGPAGERYPACGATIEARGERTRGQVWTRTLIPKGSPSGDAAVQFDFPAKGDGEGYFGWAFQDMPPVSQGAVRYLRFRVKPLSPMKTGLGWGVKLFILGDAAVSENRIIGTWRQWCDGGCYKFHVDRNINGWEADVTEPSPDKWHAIQIRIRSSSTAAASDGGFDLYQNGKLVSKQNNRVIPTAGWEGTLGFGYYGTYGSGGEHVSYQVADFEYDDEFDETFR